MKDHEADCPRLQFWDAGDYEAPCTCLNDPSAIAQQYARRMDPRTSHDAAHAVVESGKVASQRQRILDDLALHDGATAGEIEQRLGFRSHKRMAPLERDGLVRRGLPRTCAATGMRAMTWWRT